MPYYRCAVCGLTTYGAHAHSAASVCANCSAPLRDATPLYVTPGRTRTTRRVLAARPKAVAEARREVVALPLPQGARERLALLVSELVTNAVLHSDAATGDPVRLEITMHGGRARVEVHDGGAGFDARSSGRPDPFAVSGKGLVIVAALSDAWGVVRDGDGCTVWCEVLVEEPAGHQTYPLRTASMSSLPTGPKRTIQPLSPS
jgi:anti-sigma regulatory factor (Ser/Thr protein kinase)